MAILNFLALMACLSTAFLVYQRRGWNIHIPILTFVAGAQVPFIVIGLLK